MKEFVKYDQEGMKRTLEEWEDEVRDGFIDLKRQRLLDRIDMFKFNLRSRQGEFDKPPEMVGVDF
jgi:hypothetical protein